LNWEENPIAMIDILDAQIAELHKRRNKCKEKADIIEKYGFLNQRGG